MPCSERFREAGQSVLKDLVDAMNYISGGDLIPPKKLIDLLNFLHIIAPTSGDQSTHLSAVEQYVVGLMHCILHTASKHQVDAVFNDPGRPLHVAPLIIQHMCGFVPLGVFPATLIPNNSFKLVQRGIMKKKFSFATSL